MNCVITSTGLEFLISEPESTLKAEISCPTKILLLLFFGFRQLMCALGAYFNMLKKSQEENDGTRQERKGESAFLPLFGRACLIRRRFGSKRKSFEYKLVLFPQIHCIK